MRNKNKSNEKKTWQILSQSIKHQHHTDKLNAYLCACLFLCAYRLELNHNTVADLTTSSSIWKKTNVGAVVVGSTMQSWWRWRWRRKINKTLWTGSLEQSSILNHAQKVKGKVIQLIWLRSLLLFLFNCFVWLNARARTHIAQSSSSVPTSLCAFFLSLFLYAFSMFTLLWTIFAYFFAMRFLFRFWLIEFFSFVFAAFLHTAIASNRWYHKTKPNESCCLLSIAINAVSLHPPIRPHFAFST